MNKIVRYIVVLLLSLLLVFSIFGIVHAEDVIFKITAINVNDKSSGVKVDDVSINDGSIINKITFTTVDDYIEYNITIKNNSNKDYIIKSITDNNTNNNLTYEYSNFLDEEFNKTETKDIVLKITYELENDDVTKRNISDNTSLIINFEDKEGNTEQGNININPSTGDWINIYIILFSISITGLILICNKKIRKYLLIIILIPVTVKALSSNFEIVFENNIKLRDKVVVTFDIDGVTTSQTINYNQKITNPSNPSKEGYYFVNWYLDDEVYDFDSNITDDITINALFNESQFKYVFRQDGACTFRGDKGIIGDDCSDYLGQNYIDTGVALFSNDNVEKDFEVGFDLSNNDYSLFENFATIFENKYEDSSISYPGVVSRWINQNNVMSLEISESTNRVVNRAYLELNNFNKVVIIRKNGNYFYRINDGDYVLLQEKSENLDIFDQTAWFGAAQKTDGSVCRYLKGTISNMYIKLGEMDPFEFTVTLNPNGGEINNGTVKKEALSKIGQLEESSMDGFYFAGWYTDPVDGELITEDYILTSDITLYAHYVSNAKVARINYNFYDTIQEAITAAKNQTTIEILSDTSEHISISSNKKIIMNFNNHKLSNFSTTAALISNSGRLEIVNGNLSSDASAAVINNSNSTADLVITDTKIDATSKQCIYNKGGKVTIQGSSYLNSLSNDRAALQNHSGTMIILGGTIISENFDAILIAEGNLTIGQKDEIYSDSIIVQGSGNGINTSVDISIYDGIIKGISSAINDVNKITNTEDGFTKVEDVVDNYHRLYYSN